MTLVRKLSLLVFLAPLAACATYQDDLQRATKYYETNEHERALAVFRSLEDDIDSLPASDRVRYYYFRGMTDYRLASDTFKVRPDARYWLGLAQAGEKETPNSLSEEQKGRLKDALDDLNKDVYGGADSAGDEVKSDKDKKADKKKDDEPKKKKKVVDDEDDAPKKKKKSE